MQSIELLFVMYSLFKYLHIVHSKTEDQNFTLCKTSELISSPESFDTTLDIIFNYSQFMIL